MITVIENINTDSILTNQKASNGRLRIINSDIVKSILPQEAKTEVQAFKLKVTINKKPQ